MSEDTFKIGEATFTRRYSRSESWYSWEISGTCHDDIIGELASAYYDAAQEIERLKVDNERKKTSIRDASDGLIKMRAELDTANLLIDALKAEKSRSEPTTKPAPLTDEQRSSWLDDIAQCNFSDPYKRHLSKIVRRIP